MTSLPTLRRKIFQSFSVMILLYGVLGIILVMSMLTVSKTTPKILHVNYDSISAAIQMKQAWNALESPAAYSDFPTSHWVTQFELALESEEHHITEGREKDITASLRAHWDRVKTQLTPPAKKDFTEVDQLLSDLIGVNEKAMFLLAQQNTYSGNYILIGSLCYFLISLVLAFLLADGLANRLSTPIKSIVEALHRRPEIGRRLKLVTPNSLELLILTTELNRLWGKVTESEQTNVRELLEQKNKLEIVLESVEDALLVLDTSGLVSHANRCMQGLIGLKPQDIVGQKWNDLSTTHENYLKLRSTLRPDMNDAQKMELVMGAASHQFSARHRKILGSGGQHTGILYLLHDVTEKMQKQRFREDFIDLLSHEIKTPLQSLGTATELLISQKEGLPDSLKSLTETIAEDVDRIRAVANEFVQVTQSQSKILKIRLELVDLNMQLPEWIRPFKVVAKDRNVRLSYQSEGSEAIWANLDPVKFPWVISNILSNAIRFSPEGAEVVILLTDRNGAVEIQVKDDGPGITSADEKRIFEPFFQSALATTTGKKGLFGIGLTIAKEVVEADDGRIEYYRRPSKGSEFRIVLPFPPA